MAAGESWMQKWLDKARNDLRTAEATVELADPPTDTICFHAQQCVEKCLKAYLTHRWIPVERTHDLVRLNRLCSEIDGESIQIDDLCTTLTPYAVEARYPSDILNQPIEDSREAIQAGQARELA